MLCPRRLFLNEVKHDLGVDPRLGYVLGQYPHCDDGRALFSALIFTRPGKSVNEQDSLVSLAHPQNREPSLHVVLQHQVFPFGVLVPLP